MRPTINPRRNQAALSLLLLLASMLVAAACSSSTATDATDATAPLLVRGVVHDIAEHPVLDATVSLTASGPSPAMADEPGPVVFEQRVPVAGDGSFQFRSLPTDALRTVATARGRLVSFFVTARDGTGAPLGQWQFERTLVADAWSGDAPGVVIRPVNAGPDGCC